jgi:hypothetical protein
VGRGKEQLTTTYQWFLARWAKRLPWQEAADVLRTSWDTVYRAVTLAVLWGVAHRPLEGSRPSAWTRSSGARGTST